MTHPLCFAWASILAASRAISLVKGSTGIAAKIVSQIVPPLPGQFRCVGTVETVLQFNDGDGREYHFGFALFPFEYRQQFTYWLSVALGGDQYAGVQD